MYATRLPATAAVRDEKQRDNPKKETSRLEVGARQPDLGDGALELYAPRWKRLDARWWTGMCGQSASQRRPDHAEADKQFSIRLSASRREENRRKAKKGKLKTAAQRPESPLLIIFSFLMEYHSDYLGLLFQPQRQIGETERNPPDGLEHETELVFSPRPIRVFLELNSSSFSTLLFSKMTTLAKYGPCSKDAQATAGSDGAAHHTVHMAHDMYTTFEKPGGALLVRSQITDVQRSLRFSVAC
ncbi:hypothetical protein R3P38DRAFT_2783689 [Favolaschia claudopus]|uniref:Uncharacterized protein n=1 Tax=Favolaschia claudopus TaxID=2862362 RepID=A0AAW0AZU8_9AGAR